MKRQIKSSRGEKRFLAPRSPRTVERRFAQDMADMVALMARIYKNQTLGALNKSTIEKFADAMPSEFADAQQGNYANIFMKLSRASRKKLMQRFSNVRIDAMVNQRLTEADKSNSDRLYARIEQAVGISAHELRATEGLSTVRKALNIETAEWIKKTRDETLEYFTANTLRAMTLGQGLDTIMAEFDDMVENRKNHARFVAANQINNYNSIMTKTRAQELGVTKAIWRTEQDERVRPSHADREGKEFDLSKGLYSAKDGLHLLPSVDYNCRCDYELIIPED